MHFNRQIASWCAVAALVAGVAVAETDYKALPIIQDIQRGVNNANQIEDLRVKDDATIGDDLAVAGDAAVTGGATVGGTLGVTGAATAASLDVAGAINFGATNAQLTIVGTTAVIIVNGVTNVLDANINAP